VLAPRHMTKAQGGASMTDIISGVYEIRNTQNGHRYIGGSINLLHRFKEHRNDLRRKIHHSVYLQRAWDKYGEGIFVFRILLYCDPRTLHYYEQVCIDRLPHEYNISKSALIPMLGRKHTEESKRLIALAGIGNTHQTGRKETELQRQHIAASLIGNKRRLGIPHTEETKTKLKIARQGRTPNLGHTHTEGTRQRMSETHKRLWAIKKGLEDNA
jgi:group I intron endonuclease